MKSIYLIAYDLHTPGMTYNELYDAIKSYNDWQHPLESMWFICTEETDLQEIYKNLRKHIDDNDNIYVQKVDAEIKEQGWLSKSFWEWLTDRRKNA